MFEYKYVAWLERLPFKSKSGFDTNSLPYILATDFPFLVWSQLSWQGRRVLIIADSGDNILTLWPLGVKEIIAVDIAQKACFLNELKGVALKELDFTSFRALFAPAFKNPFFPEVTPADKRNIYFKLRDFLISYLFLVTFHTLAIYFKGFFLSSFVIDITLSIAGCPSNKGAI